MKFPSISAILVLGFLAISNQIHAGPAYEEVATFPAGLYPQNSGLVSDGAGFLWGTTKGTGSGGNFGTVFKVSEYGFNSAAPTTVATFTDTGGLVKGNAPYAELINDGAGYMWGTTSAGGAFGHGTIFKINIADSTFTTVIEFNNNSAPLGRQPYGGLVSDGSGNLWGTCKFGGASDLGTVFKVTNPGGVLTTVVEFTGTSGSYLGSAPMGRMVYQNEKLWGTTSAGGTSSKGTVFSYNSVTGKFLSVASFTGIGGALPGESPEGALVLNDTGSYLYGTTRLGGSGVLNNGTIFKVSTAYFVDEFNTGHDFLASGVTGTDWGGILLSGNLVSGGISGGILTWQNAANTQWDVGVATSPFLYVPVTGDFTVYLHVLSAVDGGFPSGGLIVYDPSFPPASSNWIYLDYHFNEFNVLFNAVLGGGFDGSTGNRAVTPKGGYMKIVRTGNTFTGYTKVDVNDPWREVGIQDHPTQDPNIVRNDIPATVYVGLTSMSFGGPPTTATFESFSVLPEPADVQVSNVLSFDGNGANPIGGLVSDGAGNFIGTTNQGGTSGFGTIFSVTAGGTLTTLYNFTGSAGAVRGRNPGYGSMLKHTDGDYYGVATDTTGAPTGDGKVFRLRVGPSPVTTAATLVSAVRGTLNGTVNPNSYGATDYYFEWGTSPTLAGASVTSTGNIADGSSAVPVSAALTGLTEFTTYYYRLVATNAGNAVTQKGEIFSFVATGASIDSITASADGTYRATQNIDFTVVFSAPVTVTGNPRIPVNVGGSSLFATYNSGTTTNTLVFRYTVAAPDTDSNGIASSSPIGLNGGTINTAGGTASSLTFTPPTTTGILVDTTAPTAAISYSPTGPVRAGTSLTITATFSEPLLDSPVVRLAISGSNTLAATNMVKSSTTVYTYSHTVGAGDGTATVAMSVGTDAGGNVVTSAPTSGSTFTVDNTAPTVTINQAGGQADPSNSSPINFTVVFSESVANFATGDVSLSGTAGATTGTVTGGGTTYNVAVSGMTSNGTVIASLSAGVASDAAGNTSAASTSTDNTVTRDVTVPTLSPVTIASNNATTSLAKVGDVITLSFTSSEAIQTPTVTLAGTATTVSNPSGNNWTASFTVGAGTPQGAASISVTFSDIAGNAGTAVTATTNGSSVTVDRTAPTVTINQAGGQSDPTNGSSIDFTVVFSESVTNFATGDVTLSGTAGATTGTVTGSGTTYNVAVTGMTSGGTVIASLAAGVASDATGNLTPASTSTDNTVTRDVTAPTLSPVTIASNNANTAQAKVGDVITLSFVSSEAIQTPTVTLAGSAAVVANGGGNNWTATLTVTGGTTEGAAAISVTFSDISGNAGTTVTATTNASSVNVDRTAPTVTINQDGGQADPFSGSPINFAVIFSETVANFVTGDVTLGGTTGGTKVGTVTGSGTTYNVAVTGMTGEGTVIASLAAGVASDAAGNTSAASTSTDNTVTRDTVVPSAPSVPDLAAGSDSGSSSTDNITNVTTPTFTGTAESGSTVRIYDGITLVGTGTATGGNYSIAVSALTPGSRSMTATATDAANNLSAASAALVITVDTTAPTVTINQDAGQPDPSNETTIDFAVVFSESVADFATGDVTLSGTASPTTGTVTGSGTTYNVAVTGMGATGTIIASLAAGVASDTAGNTSAASTSTDNTVTRDTTVPSAPSVPDLAAGSDSGSSSTDDITNVTTPTFTGTAESGSTVRIYDGITLVGTGTATGGNYSIAVSALTPGSRSMTATATDPAGNLSAASAALVITVDTTAPTVTINQDAGQPDPSNETTIDFAVVFSESVADFATGDVTLSGTASPTTGTVTGSGTTYNVAVTGMGATGTIIASLAAGVASDTAGNTSAASTSTDNTVTRDTTVPSAPSVPDLAAGSDSGSSSTDNITNVTTPTFTGTAESGSTVRIYDGITLVGTGTATGGNYSIAVSALAPGSRSMTATATDPAGNLSAASAALVITVDTTAPTVTINQAGGQSDPSNTTPIDFTVVFSESVANFVTGDATLSGTAGATTGTVFGSGTTYNVAVSGMTGNGTVIASLAAGVASDAAGNTSAASTSTDNTVTRDTSAPTLSPVSIASNNANTAFAKVGDVITLSFTASEAIQTPTITLAGTAATVLNTGGNNWTGTLTVGGGTTEGVTTISVTFSDLAGNAGTAVTSTTDASSVTVDRTSPGVTINQAVGQADPINAGPINFTVVFSQPVANFATGDVTLSGTAGATTGTVTGSGTTYNVAVTGMTGTGTVIASLAAGVATDAAGNNTQASTSTDNTVTYDVTIPTIVNVVGPPPGTYNTGTDLLFTATFTEPVNVTGAPSIAVDIDGTPVTATYVSGSGTTAIVFAYTIQATDPDTTNITTGTSISLNGGTIRDFATNDATLTFSAPTIVGVTVDTSLVAVTINQAVGQDDPTNVSPINFTVVFSESVANFATGDVTLGGTAGATTATVTGSGTTYNVAVTGMTGTGTVIASIAGAVATDGGGNANLASTSTDNMVTYDVTTATITGVTGPGAGNYGPGNDLVFTATFTEPVTVTGNPSISFTIGGVPVVATYVSGSGTTELVFEYTIQPGDPNSSTLVSGSSIALNGGTITDLAGNNVTLTFSAPTISGVTVDTTAVTVTINQKVGQSDPVNSSPIEFTVVFSETVADFATGDVTLGGTAGATTATVTGSGTTYNVAVTGMTGSGTVIASLAAGVANDIAGNDNQASTSTDNTVTYDVTTATIVGVAGPGAGSYGPGDDLVFTATFTEPVIVVGAPSIDLTVGGVPVTATYVSGSGTTALVFEYTIQPGDTGSIISDSDITLNGGTIQDQAGNNVALTFTPPNVGGVTVDTTEVTVTINQAVGQDDPTNAGPINFTVVFSESVANFATGDVTLGGTAGATTGTVTGSGTTYNVAVTGMTGSGTVIASLAAGVASDAATNDNQASTSTDNTVTYDVTTATIVGVTGPAAGTYGPGDDLVFTATFTEPVTVVGTPSIDLTVGGVPVTATYVSGSGTTELIFEYTIQPGDTGVITTGSDIDLNGGTVQDAAGNNVTLTFTPPSVAGITVDTTAVTVTINQAVGQADPINAGPINFTVVFSESVADFATGDVTLGGTAGATTAIVTGSGTTYNVAVSGMTVTGTVTASVAAGVASDVAANANLVSTSTDNTVTYDVTTATITGVTGPGAGSYGPGDDLIFTATFTEPVTVVGTPTIELTVGGVPVIATYVSGSGTTELVFEYTIQPGDGGVITTGSDIVLNGGTIQDGAGNNVALTFTPPTVNGVTVDTTAVTVTINQAVGQADPTNAGPINFTVVFSESVSDFATGDVTLGGTAGATTGTVTGSGTTYNVAVTGMTGSGTVIASLAAGVANDAAGNDNQASTSTDNTVSYDVTVATIVEVTGPAAGSYNAGDDLVFTSTFTEPVFVVGTPTIDITIGGVPVIATYVSGSGTTDLIFIYTVQPGDPDTGSIVTDSDIALNGGTIRDGAGNNVSLTFTPPTISGVTVDTTSTSVTINQAVGQVDPTNGSTINFTVVFSESVANFATGDVSLSGTAGAMTATVTGSGTTYNVAVTGMTSSGTVIASLAAGVATDGAGNNTLASTSTDNTVTYDVTTATIVGVTGPPDGSYGPGDDLVFTATFTEPVNVVGTPTIDLIIGGVPVTATYVSGSGTTELVFEYTIQPGDGGIITTGSDISLNGGTIRDGAGNDVALTFTPPSVGGVTVDTTSVTVTINQAVGQDDPTNDSTINFTVVFSESVANFVTGDVTLSGTAGATTGTVTGSGTTYNVAVTGMTGSGTVIASLLTGVASDAAGNDNAASTSTDNTVAYDVTTATIVGVTGPPAGSYNTGEGLVFTATFTEPVTVTGTPTIDLVIGGVPVTATYVSGSGTTELVFVYVIQPGDPDSSVITTGSGISLNGGTIQDGAGNNVALTFTPPTISGVSVDRTPPSVTVNKAVGQADPTNFSPINFTVTFSEPVADFDASDVTLNGTAGATTAFVSGSGDTYNVAVTGMTGTGTVIVSLAAGVATDAAANASLASTSTDNSVIYDITAPTILNVIPVANGSYQQGTSLTFTANFSEVVNVVGAPYIALTIGSTPHTADYVSGSGTTSLVFSYTIQAGDSDNDGIASAAVITLNGGSIRDTALNNGVLSFTPLTTNAVLVDTATPSVSAVTIYTGNPSGTLAKATDTITVALTASEAIQPPIVTIAGASATVANTGGNSWTGTILVGAGTPEGVAAISVSYSDIAGNSGVSLTATTDSTSVTVDRTAPVLTLPSNQTIEATSASGAVATYSPSATDANGVVSTVSVPASGSVFVIGNTTVNVASTDTAGNVANGSFTVTVEDATAPVLTVEDMVVEATGPDGAIATFSPVATDSVSSVDVVCVPASGTLFPFGTTTVNVTATDGAGQVTTDSFTVTVQDTTAPVITVPDNVVVLVLTPRSETATYTPTATDVVSTPVVVVDPPSGSVFPFGTTTVNVTATDSYGNESTASFTVSVQTYVAGVYNGLVNPTVSSTTPGDHVGWITMKMTKKGTFTGKVTLAGTFKTVSIKGVIDRDGKITFGKTLLPQFSIIRKGKPVLLLSLSLDLVAGPDARRLVGVLKDTSQVSVSTVRADRAHYTAKKVPVPPLVNVPVTLLNPLTDKGRYTALVQPRSPVDTGLAASAFPQGDGWARISVLKSGLAKVTGKLADGTAFSCARPLSKENEFPLFAAIYGRKGSISGMLTFRDVANVSDADGVGLRWFKPVTPTSKTYPQGWGVNGILVDMYASKFVRPPLGQSAFLLPGVALPNVQLNGTLKLSNGLLASSESNDVSISDKSVVTILGPTPTLVGSTNIKCKVSPTTGTISGSFLNVSSGKATPFTGVIFQKQKLGSGYFIGTPPVGVIGTGEGGLMTLEPIVIP